MANDVTKENMMAILLHTLAATCGEWYEKITGDPNELIQLLERHGATEWVQELDEGLIDGIDKYSPEYAACRDVFGRYCDNSCWKKTCDQMADELIAHINEKHAEEESE